MLCSCIPEQYLARVGATKDEVGVERRECYAQHICLYTMSAIAEAVHLRAHLRVEDEFRPLEQVEIPNGDDSIRLVEHLWILVVRCDT